MQKEKEKKEVKVTQAHKWYDGKSEEYFKIVRAITAIAEEVFADSENKGVVEHMAKAYRKTLEEIRSGAKPVYWPLSPRAQNRLPRLQGDQLVYSTESACLLLYALYKPLKTTKSQKVIYI